MITFGALQNGCEYINPTRRSKTGVSFQKDLNPVKLVAADDGRTELVIISAVSIIHASIQPFGEHTPESGSTPVYCVCFTDIFHGCKLADRIFKVIKSVLYNVRLFLNNFKPLFVIDTIPKRAGAGNNCAVCNFTVKNNVYSFPVNIGFILRYG